MEYITRRAEALLRRHLRRGKSILLLGPRQTGKTTLLGRISADLRLSFVDPRVRQRYERQPDQLPGELEALAKRRKRPLVVIDEVQKVPRVPCDSGRASRQFPGGNCPGSSLERVNATLLPGGRTVADRDSQRL